MQLEVWAVAVVHRSHDRTGVLWVAQAEGVADLVDCHDHQVGAVAPPLCPQLVFVKVDDARLGSISVG